MMISRVFYIVFYIEFNWEHMNVPCLSSSEPPIFSLSHSIRNHRSAQMSNLKAQVEATHIIMAFFVYVFNFYFYLPSEAFHVAEEGSIWWRTVSSSSELAVILLQKLSIFALLLIGRAAKCSVGQQDVLH